MAKKQITETQAETLQESANASNNETTQETDTLTETQAETTTPDQEPQEIATAATATAKLQEAIDALNRVIAHRAAAGMAVTRMRIIAQELRTAAKTLERYA